MSGPVRDWENWLALMNVLILMSLKVCFDQRSNRRNKFLKFSIATRNRSFAVIVPSATGCLSPIQRLLINWIRHIWLFRNFAQKGLERNMIRAFAVKLDFLIILYILINCESFTWMYSKFPFDDFLWWKHRHEKNLDGKTAQLHWTDCQAQQVLRILSTSTTKYPIRFALNAKRNNESVFLSPKLSSSSSTFSSSW